MSETKNISLHGLRTFLQPLIRLINRKAESWEDLKGKPFGSKIEEVKLVDNVSVTLTDLFGDGIPAAEFYVDLVEGQIYYVIYDGVTYECESVNVGRGDIYIGNSELVGNPFQIGNGEPFLIGAGLIAGETLNSTHTITITTKKETIKKLDSKYINMPEGILTSSNYLETTAGMQKGNGEVFNNYDGNYADGYMSHAEGSGTYANGNYTHAEGLHTSAYENATHTEGYETYANAPYSHAEGWATRIDINGEAAHAEGYDTSVNAKYAHAEGWATIARGRAAHAEGYQTRATGEYSHVEGSSSIASGNSSHAEGSAYAINSFSHAEGYDTVACDTAHSEGRQTLAYGDYSHVEGFGYGFKLRISGDGGTTTYTYSNADYNYSGAVLGLCRVLLVDDDLYSISRIDTDAKTITLTETISSTAISSVSCFAYQSGAFGSESHAEGLGTIAEGTATHVEGNATVAKNYYSHAEGYHTIAGGSQSHAEGFGVHTFVYLTGEANATEYTLKNNTIDIQKGALVSLDDKNFVVVIGKNYNHIWVSSTLSTTALTEAKVYAYHGIAQGNSSHVEGFKCTALGHTSHAEGNHTVALSDDQHVQGRYNIPDIEGKYAHIIGNGYFTDLYSQTTSNAHTLDWSGNAWYQTSVCVGGADQTAAPTSLAANGLILTDEATGTKYRVYINNAKLTMEVIS